MRPDAGTGRDLFDEALAALSRRYDDARGLVGRDTGTGTFQSPRDNLWYALCLLITQDDTSRAEAVIRNVLSLQERRPGDPHYGNFFWLFEDEVVTDLNAVEFVLECLVHILLHARERLSARLREEVSRAMRLGLEEVARLDVHWTYTNIYLLDVHNSILGGEILGDEALAARGLRRLRDWADRTKADGAPHEFNSATYSAVQLTALASIGQFTRDGEARALALEMEELLWRHVGRHYHVPTRQLAGPHSRAYRRDVVGAPDFLKVVLYRLLGDPRLLAETPYYDGPGREGGVLVALTEYHCPPDARALFERAETRTVRECASREEGMELVTHLTPEYALGTMSRPYGVGDPPEVWPGHNACSLYFVRDGEPGYGLLYCRYLLNDRRVGQFVYESSREALDLWEEGAFRTAQEGGDAIVAYGLVPRGQRHVTSLRLDLRLLGFDDGGEVLAGGQRFRGERLELVDVAPVAIATGGVYIGARPLRPTRLGHEAPLALWRDGGETIVSIYNYRGPPKQFWEYRSLAGPFFKGNVRNGFALRVVSRTAYASLEEFAAGLERETLSDEVDGSMRTIRFGAGPVELAYDLRELR